MRLSYYQREIGDLRSYLGLSEDDRGRVLIEQYPTQFRQWIATQDPDIVIDPSSGTTAADAAEPDAFWNEALSDLAEDIVDEIAVGFYRAVADSLEAGMDHYDEEGDYIEPPESPIAWGSGQGRNPWADPTSPTFLHMDYAGTVKNQWLVHFTKDAYSIADQGFTRGIADPRMVGLTTRDEVEKLKEGGGYNFAYLLQDYLRYGKYDDEKVEDYGLDHPWAYGPEAVIFRASGILVHHLVDNEPQVIFWGPSANTIIPVTTPLYSCLTDRVLVNTDEIEESIDWVVANFEQYRKHLTCARYLMPDEVYYKREESM